MLEEKLIKIMKLHKNLVRDLELIKSLNLPNWCIAAGYVRNYVWDQLHGYSTPTPLNDIDVIYYDKDNQSELMEMNLEKYLNEKTNLSLWSVKNQARMHLQNNDEPYHSILDAMSRWPETATAVGITLEAGNHLKLIAPYGVGDLFEMKVKRSPLFKNKQFYRSRVSKKKWDKLWPMIEIEWD